MAERYRNRSRAGDDLATRLLVGLGQSLVNLVRLPFRHRARANFDRGQYREEWDKIIGLAADTTEVHWQQAVIQADKLVDQALRELRLPGDIFSDRLKAAEGRFPHDIYNRLWQAHKLRNNITHVSPFHIDRQDLEDALDGYERALSRLGAL